MTGKSIPVIDIAPLADPASAAAVRAAHELCRAYETVGFAYVVGHGVPDSLIEDTFAQSRAFHASSPARKQSLAINRAHRGYMGYATSTVVTSTVNRNTHPNLSESLMIMHELADGDPDLLAGRPLAGPNQWPDWLPDFEPTVRRYIDAVEPVCRHILRAFELGLDLPAGYLAPLFAKPVTFLRMLHYPPHPVDAHENQFGSAPHTDYGCMTLLAQDRSGGLQVRDPDGGWIDAPPLDGSFVLNAGDLMPLWTNGRIKSTPHRVVNRSGGDRYSLPFFFDPGMDAPTAPLPGFTGNDKASSPVSYGDYLMARLNKNYGHDLQND
jgi:isopenicillin N synthase-like dioxygenase